MKGKPIIAVVDDKPENRSQVVASIRAMNVKIVALDSYESFFRKFPVGTRLPDIIILDFFLEKGMTGVHIIQELKRRSPDFQTKVGVIGFSSIELCSKKIAKEGGGIALRKDKSATEDRRLIPAVEMLLERLKREGAEKSIAET